MKFMTHQHGQTHNADFYRKRERNRIFLTVVNRICCSTEKHWIHTHKHNKTTFSLVVLVSFYSNLRKQISFEVCCCCCCAFAEYIGMLAIVWFSSNFYFICWFGWFGGFPGLRGNLEAHKACIRCFIRIDCGSTNKQIKFKWWSWSFIAIELSWAKKREFRGQVGYGGAEREIDKNISKQFELLGDNDREEMSKLSELNECMEIRRNSQLWA